MSDLVGITARIKPETKEALDEITRQRRMQTGEAVSFSDLVREALQEFVERHKP